MCKETIHFGQKWHQLAEYLAVVDLFPCFVGLQCWKRKNDSLFWRFWEGFGLGEEPKKVQKNKEYKLDSCLFLGVVAYQDRHLQTTVKEVFGFLNFNDVTHLPTCAQRDWIQVGLIWKCPNITFEEPSRSWLPSSGGKLWALGMSTAPSDILV